MKKVLITGVTGFAGSFLAEYLSEGAELEIHGTFLSDDSLSNIASVQDKVITHKLDLNDSLATENLIADIKPDFIYHLAALASAAESFKNPRDYINNNISAEVNILEGVKKANISPRVLIVSSAEVYGNVKKENLPIDESVLLRPINPYAVSKIAQDFLGLQYFLSYGTPVVIVRPFNHIGPRQSPVFAIPSFASKIVAIEKGEESVLRVGNLDARRDLTDVRDVVEGYKLLIEKGVPGEVYNIGRGESFKMREILDKLISMSSSQITVEVDESLLRPVDVEELVCDNRKLKEATGWEPRIPMDKTLNDTLDYWRHLT